MPPSPKASKDEIQLTIHNLTTSALHLTNSAHAFLEPVLIPPCSLGPLAYLPPSGGGSPSLDLVLSTTAELSGHGEVWQISVPRKARGKSWKTGGWERLDVVRSSQGQGRSEEDYGGRSSNRGRSDSGASSGRTLGPCAAGSNQTLKAYRLKISRAQHALILISTPPTDSWMSSLPDSTPLGNVTMPGTHQSTALYGWPISQCQQPSSPLGVQLKEGIRFLDVRLAEKNGELIAYHGILTQRARFPSLLTQCLSFLSSPLSSRETIIMSIQQENAATPLFLSLLKQHISDSGREHWFLENRIPSLGQVRGKIVLFSRFGGTDRREWEDIGGMGLHVDGWRDSVRGGFEVSLPEGKEKEGFGWKMAIQDWYNIGSVLSIPEKTQDVKTIVTTQTPLSHHVPLAFCSASSFPLACPTHVAKGFGYPAWGAGIAGVNVRIGRWLLEVLAEVAKASSEKEAEESEPATGKEENGEDAVRQAKDEQRKRLLRGWILLDFYRSEPGLIDLLISFNFC